VVLTEHAPLTAASAPTRVGDAVKFVDFCLDNGEYLKTEGYIDRCDGLYGAKTGEDIN